MGAPQVPRACFPTAQDARGLKVDGGGHTIAWQSTIGMPCGGPGVPVWHCATNTVLNGDARCTCMEGGGVLE